MKRDVGGREILRLPDEDPTTWKLLLYWTTKRSLPFEPDPRYADDEDSVSLLIFLSRCWICGERYAASSFQDAVMIQLLRVLKTVNVTAEVIEVAFNRAVPNSKLCALMAQEAMADLKTAEPVVTPEILQQIRGAGNNLKVLMSAAAMAEDIDCSGRLEDEGVWKSFMVGNGPHYLGN